MHVEQHRTPDKGWAWIISLAIGAINGITFGLIRSFGVYFFYLRHHFGLSRQAASWPFALCTSCTYLTGPITSFLIAYFHLRTLVIVGVLTASISFASCYLISEYYQIVLLIGIIHGFGNGLSYMQTPVIIAQYFSKYTATATAISYAGGTVGSFLFPPLIETVIKHYGLRGSFLIIGAVLLNGLPCALLLRPPIPPATSSSRSSSDSSGSNHILLRRSSHRSSVYSLNNSTKNGEKFISLRKTSLDLYLERQQLQQIPHHCQPYKASAQKMVEQFTETEEILVMESINNLELINLKVEEIIEKTTTVPTKNKYSQTIHSSFKKPNQLIHAIAAIMSNPMYIILLITHVSFQWTWMTYQIVIFDFAIDQNLTHLQSVSILVGFALADLLGRIVSGWAADRQLMQKNHIVSLCILSIGFLIQLTPQIISYNAYLALTLLLGFACGMIIVLFNLLIIDYVGLDLLPVALGVSAFFVGLTSLARPYFIGLFRDLLGVYDGLFHFVGTLALLAALLWLMEPFAVLHFKRSRR